MRLARRVRGPLLAALLLAQVLAAPVAHAQGATLLVPGKDVDTEFPDPPPPPPNDGKLQPIDVGATSAARFAIDTSSVRISEDVIVRFAMVVTSESGVRNVSYDAVRCDKFERKLLAIGQPDGSWQALRSPAWAEIGSRSASAPSLKVVHRALCEGGAVVRNPARALANINSMPSNIKGY